MSEKKKERILESTDKKMKKSGKKEEKRKKESISLKDQLKKKEEEIAAHINILKHLQAEFENYKKRIIREQTGFLEFASKGIIAKMLPVLDNFERALNSAHEPNDFEAFKKGVEMVYVQLVDILSKEGLKVVDPVDKQFDPREHEAIMQVEMNECEEGTVIEVLQKGYLLKEKVLRPAVVKVAKNYKSEIKEDE